MVLVGVQNDAVVGRVTCEHGESALDNVVHLLAFALVVDRSKRAALLRILILLHLLLELLNLVADLLAEHFPQQLPT